jgi:hypothetical protein
MFTHWLLRLAADCLECVPQRVEVSMSIDAEGVEMLQHFLADGAIADFFVPASAPLRDEYESGMRRVFGFLPLGENSPE